MAARGEGGQGGLVMTDNLHFFSWEVPLKAERPKVKAVGATDFRPAARVGLGSTP